MYNKRKQILALIAIASLITISGIALAFNGDWFNFLKTTDVSLDEIKMTDTITLEELPLWFDASVAVTGPGYIGQEHDVDISIYHTRDEIIWKAAGTFALFLENLGVTHPITSGSFSELTQATPYVKPTYTWIPSVSAATYTIALTIDNVVWTEIAIYTISATAGPDGKIESKGIEVRDGTPHGFSVLSGDPIGFSIIPDEGCKIADVIVDGDSVGPVSSWPETDELIPGGSITTSGVVNYLFDPVMSDHSIHATFVKEYTIIASADTGIDIIPEGSIIVLAGNNQTFIINAVTIGDILVDGVSVPITTEYTFYDVQSDHTIHIVAWSPP